MARDEAQQLAHAFEAVFGQEGHRTPPQKLVVDELEKRCFFRTPIMGLQDGGGMCPDYGRWGEGRRSVYLLILSHLEAASAERKQEQKPKTIK